MLLKKIISTSVILLIIYGITLSLHHYIITWTNSTLSYSLTEVYNFQAGFSLLICLNLLIIANISDKFKEQIGFLYLLTIVLKVLFFSLAFKEVLFSDLALNKTDSLSLLIPVFIFLTYEVVIISKILNNIEFK